MQIKSTNWRIGGFGMCIRLKVGRGMGEFSDIIGLMIFLSVSSQSPLPAEMIRYAREDTHYLLYIYDRMRHELIDRSAPGKDTLQVVLDRSRKTSLIVYKKVEYDAENGSGFRGWKNLLAKWNHILDNQQVRWRNFNRFSFWISCGQISYWLLFILAGCVQSHTRMERQDSETGG